MFAKTATIAGDDQTHDHAALRGGTARLTVPRVKQ